MGNCPGTQSKVSSLPHIEMQLNGQWKSSSSFLVFVVEIKYDNQYIAYSS